MQKINNPFSRHAGTDDYNCFGCSPANDAGLHLEFWLNDKELVAHWHPQRHYEGWAGILHGGIQGTLVDEAAAWLVFVLLGTSGVTSEMNIKYLKPLHIANGQITARATLLSFEKRLAKINCTLEDGKGVVCATSTITYFCFPAKVARERYSYPGREAFITE